MKFFSRILFVGLFLSSAAGAKDADEIRAAIDFLRTQLVVVHSLRAEGINGIGRAGRNAFATAENLLNLDAAQLARAYATRISALAVDIELALRKKRAELILVEAGMGEVPGQVAVIKSFLSGTDAVPTAAEMDLLFQISDWEKKRIDLLEADYALQKQQTETLQGLPIAFEAWTRLGAVLEEHRGTAIEFYDQLLNFDPARLRSVFDEGQRRHLAQFQLLQGERSQFRGFIAEIDGIQLKAISGLPAHYAGAYPRNFCSRLAAPQKPYCCTKTYQARCAQCPIGLPARRENQSQGKAPLNCGQRFLVRIGFRTHGFVRPRQNLALMHHQIERELDETVPDWKIP